MSHDLLVQIAYCPSITTVGCQDLKTNGGSTGTVGKSNRPYETSEKIKVAKQDTTKTIFLTLSGSNISIVMTAMTNKKTLEIVM